MIDKAVNLLPAHTNVKGLTCASMLAVLSRATHTVEIGKLEKFVDILHTGIVTADHGGAAVILLRDWMMQHGAGSSTLQTELYWKAERALRAFLDQDELKTLYAANQELFPIPGETACRVPDAVTPRRLRQRNQRKSKR